MDKMLGVILPKVILDIISNFVLYVSPKHGKNLKNNYLVYMTKYYAYNSEETLYQCDTGETLYQCDTEEALYQCDTEETLYQCDTEDVLGDISIFSDMSTIMYLHDIDELSKTDVIEHEIFINACRNGHYDLVKYLTETYKLTRDDATYDNNSAYEEAYDIGHTEITDYLTQTFNIVHVKTDESEAEFVYERDYDDCYYEASYNYARDEIPFYPNSYGYMRIAQLLQ